MEVKFEVILDTNGDKLSPDELRRWAKQIKEKLNKEWYVKTVEVCDEHNNISAADYKEE